MHHLARHLLSSPGSGRCKDILLIALLLGVSAVVVGSGMLPNRTVLPLDILDLFAPWRDDAGPPVNPLLGDPVLQFSTRAFVAQAMRSGHFPLWNPTVMSGHPHAGDTLAAPFYPLQLLLIAVLSPQRAYSIQLLLQLWLAGVFMYLWLRQLVSWRLAGLAGALTWMLAAYQQLWLAYAEHSGTLAWLPAVPAAWEYAAQGNRRAGIALGALATSLSVLGGHLQLAAMGLGVFVVYAGLRTVSMPAGERRNAARGAVGILSLGLALAAVHLFPVAEASQDTLRTPFSLEALRSTAVPVRQLVTAISPWSLGDPRDGSYQGAQNANEMALYIGILPLLVVLTTPLVRRDRLALTFTFLALSVMLLALGAPLSWPLAVVPVLNMSGLMRWLAMWPMAAAPMVALGLAAARADSVAAGRLRRGVVAWSLALLVVLLVAVVKGDALPGVLGGAVLTMVISVTALVTWASRPDSRGRTAFLLACVIVDLVAFGHGYTPSASAQDAFPAVPPLDRLAREGAVRAFRVVVFQSDPIVLGPGVAPSVGLVEIGGYTSSARRSYRDFVARLSLPADNAFLSGNANMVTVGDAQPLLLRLLNVRYILTPTPLSEAALQEIGSPGCPASQVLVPGTSVGRAFTPQADGLNLVRVQLRAGGTVALHLVQSPGDSDHLAYAEVAGETGSALDMYFEPIAESEGRSFYAYADLPASYDGPWPEVCVDDQGLVLTAGTTGQRFPLAFSANGVFVHEVPDTMGMAWTVQQAEIAESQSEALNAITRADFDPSVSVVLEAPSGLAAATDEMHLAAQATHRGGKAASASVAEVVDNGPNVRRITLDPQAGAWLVLSEAYAPGWHAKVDGRDAPVLRADGALQAVPLSPASREVVVTYRPWSVIAGTSISMAGLVVTAWLLLGATRSVER